jgi:hypothetical protein
VGISRHEETRRSTGTTTKDGQLTASIADLDTRLANVHGDDFTHFIYGFYDSKRESGVAAGSKKSERRTRTRAGGEQRMETWTNEGKSKARVLGQF